MLDVTALGELLIDFTCLSTDEAGFPTMVAHPGGAPVNFLAALAKFGAKTALFSNVGQDAFGRLLVGTMENLGINTQGITVDNDAFTTLAFVTLDKNGDREFSFSRKPGADTRIPFDRLPLTLIDEAKVFHFGTLSLTDEPARTATQKAVAYARERDKLITFDPNLRKPLWKDLTTAKEQMLWGLGQADVVKISEDEAEFLFGTGPEESAKLLLERFGLKLVFVTCGPEGCFFQNALARGWVPSLKGVRVVDTTGAGDIFGGSALWKLLQYGKAPQTLELEELTDVARFACTAAALSTTKPGGASSVPEYAEVLKNL